MSIAHTPRLGNVASNAAVSTPAAAWSSVPEAQVDTAALLARQFPGATFYTSTAFDDAAMVPPETFATATGLCDTREQEGSTTLPSLFPVGERPKPTPTDRLNAPAESAGARRLRRSGVGGVVIAASGHQLTFEAYFDELFRAVAWRTASSPAAQHRADDVRSGHGGGIGIDVGTGDARAGDDGFGSAGAMVYAPAANVLVAIVGGTGEGKTLLMEALRAYLLGHRRRGTPTMSDHGGGGGAGITIGGGVRVVDMQHPSCCSWDPRRAVISHFFEDDWEGSGVGSDEDNSRSNTAAVASAFLTSVGLNSVRMFFRLN